MDVEIGVFYWLDESHAEREFITIKVATFHISSLITPEGRLGNSQIIYEVFTSGTFFLFETCHMRRRSVVRYSDSLSYSRRMRRSVMYNTERAVI